MLSNATYQRKSTVELGYMCPRGLTGPPAVTLTKQLKYKKRILLYVYTILNQMVMIGIFQAFATGLACHQYSFVPSLSYNCLDHPSPNG